MGLAGLHFSDLVLNLRLEKQNDDHDGDDVDDQNHPGACTPRTEHDFPSNRWADVDVHVAPRFADATQSGTLFHQPVVKTGVEFFGERYLAENQTDHAGSTRSRGAVGGQGDSARLGVFNDGFSGVHGALPEQVGAS